MSLANSQLEAERVTGMGVFITQPGFKGKL